jgi:hypothetical protein
VNHLSLTVEVLAAQRRDGKGASAPVIAFEKGQRIAARDDTGALVMQTWRWVALEECDVVGVRWWKAFEGEGRCEAAERGSDLGRGVRGVLNLVTGSLRALGGTYNDNVQAGSGSMGEIVGRRGGRSVGDRHGIGEACSAGRLQRGRSDVAAMAK